MHGSPSVSLCTFSESGICNSYSSSANERYFRMLYRGLSFFCLLDSRFPIFSTLQIHVFRFIEAVFEKRFLKRKLCSHLDLNSPSCYFHLLFPKEQVLEFNIISYCAISEMLYHCDERFHHFLYFNLYNVDDRITIDRVTNDTVKRPPSEVKFHFKHGRNLSTKVRLSSSLSLMFQVTGFEAPIVHAPEGGCIYGETLVPHCTDAGRRTNERGGVPY